MVCVSGVADVEGVHHEQNQDETMAGVTFDAATPAEAGTQEQPERDARALRKELFSDELIDELMSRVDADGLTLTGQGGFLPELVKAVLERGMDAELTDHLATNAATRPAGQWELPQRDDPEDGRHRGRRPPAGPAPGPQLHLRLRLVPKGVRRLGGLEDMIISLYAGGMTIRDIQHHLASTLGTDLSHETISNVTEAVAEEVTAWQARPLEAFYPVVYLDALVVKIRDGAHVSNRAAHLAVGVDLDGVKHVLGIWVQAAEGAKFWAGVCAELANRGVKDVLIVCCDGLTGLPEAIEATWSTPPSKPASCT